jgi:uncharacterized protein YndB with AHSA1/START domain
MVTHEVGFHGEYHEIVPNQRIVATDVFEGMSDSPGLTTTTFAEHGGGTLLTILVEHASREVSDAHAAGMKEGLDDALDLAAEVAASLDCGPPRVGALPSLRARGPHRRGPDALLAG